MTAPNYNFWLADKLERFVTQTRAWKKWEKRKNEKPLDPDFAPATFDEGDSHEYKYNSMGTVA